MRKVLVIFIWVIVLNLLHGQTPGVSVFYEQFPGDTREYIEYIPGNLPIILSGPHGGVKQSGRTIGGVFYPDNDTSLPDRSCGVNERDDNTDILVREIAQSIFDSTGCYPYVILSNLHRSKLDPNREIGEAACGDTDAEDHWNAYHGFIDSASMEIEAAWGKGIFLDVHGQSHSIPRIEVGYNVNRNDINNANLNNASVISNSTINHLVNHNIQGLTHQQLIQGDQSLGELFHNAPGVFYASLGYPGCSHNNTNGYRAIPSNTDTGNSSCDDTKPFNFPYFDGDFYNNRRHGSGPGAMENNGSLIGGGGHIDGIMTEVNRRVRDLGTYNGQTYDSRPQTLVPFADDYAHVVLEYIKFHYDDFASFSYPACTFSSVSGIVTPTISGVAGGVFTADSSIGIDPSTGAIDFSTLSPGTYEVTYTVGDCNLYSNSVSIIVEGSAVAYVDINASGNDSGADWINAYTSINQALSTACKYDTLYIAEGNYVPNTSDRNFRHGFYDGLVLEGGYSTGGIAYDPSSYIVSIDGNIGSIASASDNLYHAIYVEGDIENLVFKDIHIINGYADGVGDDAIGGGGLILGDAKFENVVFSDNSYMTGSSAVVIRGNFSAQSTVELINNNKL